MTEGCSARSGRTTGATRATMRWAARGNAGRGRHRHKTRPAQAVCAGVDEFGFGFAAEAVNTADAARRRQAIGKVSHDVRVIRDTKVISIGAFKPEAQASGSGWQKPEQPTRAYFAAAMRSRMVSAPSVRARYRASDSVSASKA